MKKFFASFNFKKFNSKMLIKIFSLICIVAICVYVFCFGLKKANSFEIYNKSTAETKIYTVWHIETFEGGAKPRIEYLKNIARKLEKENDGVLIDVKKVEPQKLRNMLNDGQPDIISFGFGVEKIVLKYLCAFEENFGVRNELVDACKFNGKVYALPYIVSGYAVFSHGVTENRIEYGTTGYNSPTIALAHNKLTAVNFGTPFETYKNFVYHQDHALLGTARDVFRVDNLNKIGRTNASITPLDSYTDLIQYIAHTRTDNIIKQFCARCFDSENQAKLSEYHLFSALKNKLYTEGIYNDMENAILKCEIAKVFD